MAWIVEDSRLQINFGAAPSRMWIAWRNEETGEHLDITGDDIDDIMGKIEDEAKRGEVATAWYQYAIQHMGKK